jgi:hypothetical protein
LIQKKYKPTFFVVKVRKIAGKARRFYATKPDNTEMIRGSIKATTSINSVCENECLTHHNPIISTGSEPDKPD